MKRNETPESALFRVRGARKSSPKSKLVDASERWAAEAYIELLERENSEPITVSAICRRAGIGRTTFYRSFRNTGDIIRNEIARVEQTALDMYEERQEIPLSVYGMNLVLLKAHREHPTVAQLSVAPEFFEIYAEGYDLVSNHAEKNYGFINASNEYAYAFRRSGVIAVYTLWLSTGMKESPQAIATFLAEQIN